MGKVVNIIAVVLVFVATVLHSVVLVIPDWLYIQVEIGQRKFGIFKMCFRGLCFNYLELGKKCKYTLYNY